MCKVFLGIYWVTWALNVKLEDRRAPKSRIVPSCIMQSVYLGTHLSYKEK